MGRAGDDVARPARLLALLLAVAAFPASAQVYPFRRFGPADGLPHSFAYTVTQDDRGYLWIGTFGGLARYDGERFLTISTKDGLPGDDVRAILQDQKGRLFVAADRGVARLDRRASGALRLGGVELKVFGVAEGLPSPAARALVEDASGAVWAATRDGGVARLGENGVVEALRSGKELPPSTVWCGARDAKGRLWFGTRGDGVFRLDGRTVVRFSLAEGLPDPNVFDLKVDAKGTLVAATSAGVARFDEESRRFSFVAYGEDASTAVSSLAFDSSGTMWVGRYGKGLAKVTPSGTAILREAQGLPNDLVTGLFVDREGSLWITMQGGGLAQFASDRFAAYDRTAGWPGGAADAFAVEPDGAVWAGSFGRGAVRIEGAEVRAFGEAQGLSDERVRALLVTRDGRVLAGTNSGVFVKPPGAARFSPFLALSSLGGGFVTALVEDGTGTLVVGTSAGLFLRDPAGRVTALKKADGLLDDFVESLSLVPDGRVFVGTGAGVDILQAGRVKSLPSSESGLPAGRIFRVVLDRWGWLWFAGDGGVACFKGKDSLADRAAWVRFGEAEGLPATAAGSIVVAPDGTLWVGTSRGLARFDGSRFAPVGARHELVSSEIVFRTGLVDQKKRLWWGTTSGPILYDGANDHPNRTPPTVLVVGAETPKASWPLPETLTVPYDARSLTFHFAALSFVDPARVVFKTRLTGFDEGWSSPSPLRQVRYTNLPPGRYDLEVFAANDDGVWSVAPARVAVTIASPWWRRAGGIALVSLLAAAVIFTGYELRVSRLRRRTGELTRLVEERTQRLVELDKRKNEFVATVSHELRNPLTSIRGTLELLSSGMLVTLPKEAVEILKLAHKNTLRLGRLIDDLIDLEKLESGTLDVETRRVSLRDVLRSAVDANRGLAQAYGVRIEAPAEPPDVAILVDEERLLQVLTNLLSNAVKFSPEEDAVVLAAEETPGGVRITVTDRGPGVPDEFRDKIFTRYAQAQTTTRRTKKGTGLGLWIAKGLVDRMGGTIGFTSAAGEGTTFYVELPRAREETA